MNILVNWETNFRPPKLKKISILTPCFLGNSLGRNLYSSNDCNFSVRPEAASVTVRQVHRPLCKS